MDICQIVADASGIASSLNYECILSLCQAPTFVTGLSQMC